MARETAVIVGAGPGLGWALVERFAQAGMHTLAAARHPEKLRQLIDGTGRGDAIQAHACDATRPEDVAALFDAATQRFGTPEVVVYNAGAYQPGGILEIAPEDFERCWRIGCYGGFLVGQAAARLMVARGGGTILFTGATASLRGSARFANLAVPKFGLRALAQSMARELAPQGVHVAHVIIDGQIDSERRRELRASRGPDALLPPAAIAETYYQLHRQPRGAWTHELDLRPWVEKF